MNVREFLTRHKVWLAFSAGLITLLLPLLLMIEGTTIWDDAFFIQAFLIHPLAKGLHPFAFDGNVYWRPWTTWTMAAPMTWVVEMGGEGVFLILSKVLSLVLFTVAALIAGRQATRGAKPTEASMAALCGVLLAIHPMFAEPSMWWSDRFDLWMCLWACLLLRLFQAQPGRLQTGLGLLLAVLACSSKESGVFWVSGAAALAWCIPGGQHKRLSLALAAGALAYGLARLWVTANVSTVFFEGSADHSDRTWSLVLFLSNFGQHAMFLALPALDPGPLHFSDRLAAFPWVGSMVVLGFVSCLWRLWVARVQGDAEAFVRWGFVSLSVWVVLLQDVLVSQTDPSLTYPLVWMRYAAPSSLVLLSLLSREAVVNGKRWAKLAVVFLLLGSAPVMFQARLGFTSEVNLWAGVYQTRPSAEVVAQYCLELMHNMQSSKAQEIAQAWRAEHPNTPNPKLDALVPQGPTP